MKLTLPSAIVTAALAAAACESSSTSTAPMIATAKALSVTGDLSFGNVNIGSKSVRTFAINNAGSAPITLTSLACKDGTGGAGFTAAPAAGVVPANASISVNVLFAPTLAEFYSCALTVVGDQTSGNAEIGASGTGIDVNR
jgi:hypothetical protein